MIPEPSLFDAILALRSQVDFLWQFFVTVHIAIFALLFIYDEAVESLNIIARAFALAGVALFEWINGKAWVIAVGAITTYTTVGGDLLLESAAIAGLFIPVCLAALAIWAGFGTAIAGWLRTPPALRAFNIAMALLLVASLVPLVLE